MNEMLLLTWFAYPALIGWIACEIRYSPKLRKLKKYEEAEKRGQ